MYKKNNYKDCKDVNGCTIRRNFPKATINEIKYNSPLDLAIKLNGINNLESRLNKDYVYTDYNLAMEEANKLKKTGE